MVCLIEPGFLYLKDIARAHPQHTFLAQRVVHLGLVHPLEDGEWEGCVALLQVGVQLVPPQQGGREVVRQVVSNCGLPANWVFRLYNSMAVHSTTCLTSWGSILLRCHSGGMLPPLCLYRLWWL